MQAQDMMNDWFHCNCKFSVNILAFSIHLVNYDAFCYFSLNAAGNSLCMLRSTHYTAAWGMKLWARLLVEALVS